MLTQRKGLRKLWIFVPASLAVLTTLVTSAIVLAHHSGIDSMRKTVNYPSDCEGDDDWPEVTCQTDNATLTYYVQSSLSVSGESNIDYTMDNAYDPTDLSVSVEDPPAYTGSSETDIIFFQDDPPIMHAVGWTWCNDNVDSVKCDQHYVGFASVSPSTLVVCHEVGHAVGLTHPYTAYPSQSNDDDSFECMQTPEEELSGFLGSHNAQQINSTY